MIKIALAFSLVGVLPSGFASNRSTSISPTWIIECQEKITDLEKQMTAKYKVYWADRRKLLSYIVTGDGRILDHAASTVIKTNNMMLVYVKDDPGGFVHGSLVEGWAQTLRDSGLLDSCITK